MPRRPGPPRLDSGLSAKGLDEIVSDRLRKEILRGDFVSGQHIVELELAQRLDVSQGTVRAALARLRDEGLVEVRPRRGNFVRTITSEDVLEIYTLRDSLEALGAKLAAERINETGKRRLQAALDRLEKAISGGDRREVMDADLSLHRLVIDLSRHGRLKKTYATLEGQTRLFMALTDHLHAGSDDEVMSDHQALVAAITDGHEERAQQLALVHNRRDGVRLAEAMKTSQAASSYVGDRPTRKASESSAIQKRARA